jgi:hypothetical protein
MQINRPLQEFKDSLDENDGVFIELEAGPDLRWWFQNTQVALQKQKDLYAYAKTKKKVVITSFPINQISEVTSAVAKVYNDNSDLIVAYDYGFNKPSSYENAINSLKNKGITKVILPMGDGGYRGGLTAPTGYTYVSVQDNVDLSSYFCSKNLYYSAFRPDRLADDSMFPKYFGNYNNPFYTQTLKIAREGCGEESKYPIVEVCRSKGGDPENAVVGQELVQYPTLVSADSGDPSALVNKQNIDSCNSFWKKSSDSSSGKIIFTFSKEVFPKTIVVRGSDAWFSKAEAWNGTGWVIIWMGEASSDNTEMNFREVSFKTNKIRITSPFGKSGKICGVKLLGNLERQNFPLCKNTGFVCDIGEVCTSSWKNSKDNSMCCGTSCEQRIFAYSLDHTIGGSSLDAFRLAEKLGMNYYMFSGSRWYQKPVDDESNEHQEKIDFYEKTKNSNIYLYSDGGGYNVRNNLVSGYNQVKSFYETYPKFKGIYVDDASNLGSKNIAEKVVELNNLKPDLVYILLGYNKHLKGWENSLNTYFGPNSNIGKKVFWTIFGDTIPCLVNNPNFFEISKINSQNPANKIGVGVYAGSYTHYYCVNYRGYAGKPYWEPQDAEFQRRVWTEGVKAGFGGFFFWNPWSYSSNGRNKDYYASGSVVNPNANTRSWTPPGVKVTNQIDLAYQLIPDLCPYCSLCGEDKSYTEDGFFGASCCSSDEKALGNSCIKKNSVVLWASGSDKGDKLIGSPDNSFRCYSGLGQDKMWKKPNKNNQDIVILDFAQSISPSHLTYYGNNILISKVEIFDSSSGNYVTVFSGSSSGLCIGTINLNSVSFKTNKIKVTLPETSYSDSALDAVALAESSNQSDYPPIISGGSYSWQPGEWSECSVGSCSNPGFRTRSVSCKQVYSGQVASDFHCTNPKPSINEVCAITSCAIGQICSGGNCVYPPIGFTDFDGDNVDDKSDLCNRTSLNLSANVNTLGCPLPRAVYFPEVLNFFKDKKPEKVRDFKLSKGNVELTFLGDLEILKENSSLNFDDNIKIENSKVEINSTNLPDLNISSVIYFKNLSFKSPRVLVDGKNCSKCKIISYDFGELLIEVPHFSIYEIVEEDTVSTNGSNNVSTNNSNYTSTNSSGNYQSTPNYSFNYNNDVDYNFGDSDSGSGEGNKTKDGLAFIVIILLVLMIIGGVVYYIIDQKKKEEKKFVQNRPVNYLSPNPSFRFRQGR